MKSELYGLEKKIDDKPGPGILRHLQLGFFLPLLSKGLGNCDGLDSEWGVWATLEISDILCILISIFT